MKKANYGKLNHARGSYMFAKNIINIWFNQKSVVKWGHLTTEAIKEAIKKEGVKKW